MYSRSALAILLAGLTFASPSFADGGSPPKKECHKDRVTGAQHCHAERQLATCDLARAPQPGDEGVFHGPIVRVVDGDSFEAKVQGVAMEFRLAQVDAPESAQPYGRNSRDELYSLVKGQTLVLVPTDTDRYGRTVAFLWVGGKCVNEELIRRGAAWFYDVYANDDYL